MSWLVRICGCGCGCESDGEWHYEGGPGCVCVALDCPCVVDAPGKPVQTEEVSSLAAEMLHQL